MSGEQLALLLIRVGPIALDWAAELAEIWSKNMTPEEVKAFCLKLRKSEDDYVKAELEKRGKVVS